VLSEKILFGELSPGQIVVVDTAPEDPMKKDGPRKFTFRGEAKPSAIAIDVDVDSAASGITAE
jgi:ATP-dependent Clp protease ATP-binding subunit ClpC